LPPLPQGWTWATVEQLCFVETGATPKRGESKYCDGSTVDWISSSAVNDAIIRGASERITDLAVKETNAKPFPVGTLIVAMYGEGKTRGKVSKLGIVAATNQACAGLLTAHLDSETKDYLRTFL
jgi:type I restriction enzyme, S subunit